MTDGKKRVYLVGVISEDPETHQWRKNVSRKLGDGFIVDDPARTRFDRNTLKEAGGDTEAMHKLYEQHESEILLPKSYQSVEDCDILLVNLQIGGEGHVGHIMELAWAYVFHKPVIAMRGGDFRSKHPMVKGIIHAWADTEDEAVEIIKLFFSKR